MESNVGDSLASRPQSAIFARMKFLRHVALLVALACPAFALDRKVPDASGYVRFIGDDRRGKLETAVVTMQNDAGVRVDLIGAVHIADPAYYQSLTKLFTGYEELLFELVDGQRLREEVEGVPKRKPKQKSAPTDQPVVKTGKPPTEENAPAEAGAQDNIAFTILRGMMQGIGSYFHLQYQTEGIDYLAKNFVHADVSMEEFQRLQEAHGESFGTLIQKAMQAELNRGLKNDEQTKGSHLLLALLGDSSGIKIAMAKVLGKVESVTEDMGMGADSVIVGERNRVAMEVFQRAVKTGRKHLGIFYGAAHLNDMQKRLGKLGYRRTTEHWLTAWDIKPKVDSLNAKPAQQ